MTECQEKCDLTSVDSKIELLTASTCGHCTEMKSLLSKQIDSGKIKVIDENSPEFMSKFNNEKVEGVPSFFVNDEYCDFTGDSRNPKLDCDGKEVIL